MPRFHFNVYDGITVMDKEGVQLSDIADARRHSIRLASELLKREAEKANLGDEWRVETTDGRGMILFRIDILVGESSAIA